MWYYVRAVSSGALKGIIETSANCIALNFLLTQAFFQSLAAEFLGEKLASFFGITTPKYQYVIDEYYRLKELVSFKLKLDKLPNQRQQKCYWISAILHANTVCVTKLNEDMSDHTLTLYILLYFCMLKQ